MQGIMHVNDNVYTQIKLKQLFHCKQNLESSKYAIFKGIDAPQWSPIDNLFIWFCITKMFNKNQACNDKSKTN